MIREWYNKIQVKHRSVIAKNYRIRYVTQKGINKCSWKTLTHGKKGIKIHKLGVSVHLILNMVNSKYCQLPQWLNKILNFSRKLMTTYRLKASFKFVTHINDINVTVKCMLSSNVPSMFTNEPLTKTVDFHCMRMRTIMTLDKLHILSRNYYLDLPLTFNFISIIL